MAPSKPDHQEARHEGERSAISLIYSFCEKADMSAINRRVLESLIRCGAMDAFEGTRAQLLLALDGAIEAGNRASKDRASGQEGLFGAFIAEDHPEPALPRANDWTPREKLQGEKEMLGFYVSGHPLDSYEEKVAELATHGDSSTHRRPRKRRRGRALPAC